MSTEPWTIRKVLTWTTEHFSRKEIDSPRLTAEVLLSHTLKVDRVRLYVDLDRPLNKEELAAYRGLIERRAGGEPTQYLTGHREFYNRRFQVDSRVLIPRPETELLVEDILRQIPKDAPARVLDVCSGSGCIAITVAAERPLAQVTAIDLSQHALEVSKANAKALGVEERVRWLEGDLLSPLPPDERFQVIVSNPPYVASDEIPKLSKEVQREPRTALDGGADGLNLIKRLIAGAHLHLEPNGVLALEIGEKQGSAVRDLMQGTLYQNVRVEKDLARLDRFVVGTWPGPSIA